VTPLAVGVTAGEAAQPVTAPVTMSVPARGTIQLLAGRVGAVACGYAITVILARGLGPADYGIYGVILSVLTVVEMAAALGIPGATIKLIPANDHDAAAVARTANFLLVVGSLALFVVLWTVAPLLARLFDIRDGTRLFRVALIDLPLTALVFAYQAALYGHRRFGAISIALVVYGVAKLAGTVALFEMGLSVVGALIVNALGTLGAVLYLVARVPTASLRPSYPVVRPLLKLAVPMGLYTALVFTLMNIDLWTLKGLGTVPPAVIGGYVAALNVARLLGVVTSVLSPVVFASVCRALASSDDAMARRQIQGAVRFALIILAPSCALIAANAESVMVAIYAEAYAGRGALLGLQAVAFAVLALLDTLLLAALASGQHRRVVGFLVVLIPLGVAIDVVLIQRLGALGAAIGFAGILALGAVGAIALAVARFGPLVRAATVVRVVGALVVVVAVDAWLDTTGVWLVVKLGLMLVLYGGLLAAFRELSGKDLGAVALWRTKTR